jgi:hypothetical protein
VPHQLQHHRHPPLHAVIPGRLDHPDQAQRLGLVRVLQHLRGLPGDGQDLRLGQRPDRLEDPDNRVPELAHLLRREPLDHPLPHPDHLATKGEITRFLQGIEALDGRVHHRPQDGGQLFQQLLLLLLPLDQPAHLRRERVDAGREGFEVVRAGRGMQGLHLQLHFPAISIR